VKEGEVNMVMYFVYMYENRAMKHVEIVLRREEGGRMMEVQDTL
jgi:hypothetical protein